MFRSFFGRGQGTAVQQLNAAQLKERIDANEALVLIDVRTPGEFERDGRIEGSRLIPLSALTARLAEIPKDKTVICICRSGNRSYTASEVLMNAGFSDVVNLSGGMLGWKRARLPFL
ncbi:MAG: rhodanese-like domain-containing protein [Chloroflexi bacterium]|nr:rhodanese-like domain-containing protein [Chloroflexota bacterium]